jgi:hypothetical protein
MISATFENLLRLYRFYEALALYDAYYERAADLNDKYKPLGNALDMAWVPLVFHCTYLKNLKSIFTDGKLLPGEGKSYIALTELPITELTRFRSLRPKPFEIAIGFPRALLETKGLFQPAYLKHATQEVKEKFTGVPPGYVELNQDLGALHEVRVPGSLSMNDAVWVLTAKRNEQTGSLDLPEFKSLQDAKIALSFWDPSHQEGMIREPVFRKEKRDTQGRLESVKCCGKHYLPEKKYFAEMKISPPAGNPFTLRFPKEVRPETLTDGWEGPFSKFEMAYFFYRELEKNDIDKVKEIRPRIKMTDKP